FLIIGAQRCGTTSMYRTLAQHPAALKPVRQKGVHFFDTGYDNGLAWYRAHFPLELTARAVHKKTGVRPQAFESSPYYMFHPLAGERIAHDLPGVKLLILLRDPVERAYSAYTHELARGYESEPFEKALELEPERLRGEAERLVSDPGCYSHAHQHNAYRTRGQYVEQLERLESVYGRQRMHVVDSQDFFERPEEVYPAVLDFLGLPNLKQPVFERHNARPRSKMSPQLQADLAAHFEPYDARLAQWLGAAPSWRR
ncbi:MAG: sulfotransferase domain-containing protein, partial [Mycobacteriales bacterium]